MKKVLALVLAVIMVCTMAMAATVTITPGTSTPGSSSAATTNLVAPGSQLEMTLDSLIPTPAATGAVRPIYLDKDGNFVPENNKVTVSFAKGAELVESQKWVCTGTDKSDLSKWVFVITLKDEVNKTATAGSAASTYVADIAISKVTVKSTGFDLVTYANTDGSPLYAAAVGYAVGADQQLVKTNGVYQFTMPTPSSNGTVYKVVKADDGTAAGYMSISNDGRLSLVAPVKSMQKFTLVENGTAAVNKMDKALTSAILAADASLVSTYKTASANVTVNGKLLQAKDTYHVYTVAPNGTITAIAGTMTDGVLTFTAPSLGYIAVVDGTLSATGTVTPGTTTNPGTGANDVVGVAAALAVVALVSGAAISLKK